MVQTQLMDWKAPRTWPKNIRWAAGFLLLCGLLAGAMIMNRGERLNVAKKNIVRVASLKQEMAMRLHNSGQERSDIARLLPMLNDLEDQGIFGEERRLEWVERLRSIENTWSGLRIRFSIEPQSLRPLPVGASGMPAKLALYGSEMKLELKLTHEMDLFRVLDALATPPVGYFETRECSLKSQGKGQALEANCSLLWYTVRPLPVTPVMGGPLG
jgi:hypothetical protein